MVKAAQTNEEDIPVTPLPDPGEGGPVYDGSMNNDPMDNGSGGNGSFGDDLSSVPVIPLPNPGEGGPVYNGPNYNRPSGGMGQPGEFPDTGIPSVFPSNRLHYPFSQVSVSPVTTALPPQALAGTHFQMLLPVIRHLTYL